MPDLEDEFVCSHPYRADHYAVKNLVVLFVFSGAHIYDLPLKICQARGLVNSSSSQNSSEKG
jgi:hypothetical protein